MLNGPQSRRRRSTGATGRAAPIARGANALERLRAGAVVFGAIQAIPGAPGTHVAIRAGAEFVILDCEHGLVDVTAHEASLQILANEDAFSAVRVRPDDLVTVDRYAALGADVILMPNVASVAAARAFVAAGRRGREGDAVDQSSTAPAPLLMAMIESKSAVAEIGDIAAVPGLSGLVVGPNDLCADLGSGADFTSPQFQAALGAVERAARAAGMVLGSGVYAGISVSRLLQGGHTFILAASDLGALQAGYRGAFDEARAMAKDIRDTK